MYWNVPRIVPCAVRFGGVVGQRRRPAPATTGAPILASPKSSSFAPAFVEHDVAGLQIAMDDARAMRLVERVGDLDRDLERLVERQRPFASRSASVSPSRYSITRNAVPSCSPTSYSAQMCG